MLSLAKVSMTSIGAPQWRHTKVGLTVPMAMGRQQRQEPAHAAACDGRDIVLAIGVGEPPVVADAMK
jgi:hypothetical protein